MKWAMEQAEEISDLVCAPLTVQKKGGKQGRGRAGEGCSLLGEVDWLAVFIFFFCLAGQGKVDAWEFCLDDAGWLVFLILVSDQRDVISECCLVLGWVGRWGRFVAVSGRIWMRCARTWFRFVSGEGCC